MNAPNSDVLDLTGIGTNLGHPHKVILFNDETHSMEEVINQIIKAIHCDPIRANAIMMQAHKTGQAIVYTGHLERCEHVSAVLEEIRLGTRIEEA